MDSSGASGNVLGPDPRLAAITYLLERAAQVLGARKVMLNEGVMHGNRGRHYFLLGHADHSSLTGLRILFPVHTTVLLVLA